MIVWYLNGTPGVFPGLTWLILEDLHPKPRHMGCHATPWRHYRYWWLLFLRSTGLGIGTVSQKISEFLQGSCEEATVTLTIKSDVQKKCLENMTSPHFHVKTALNCGPSGGLLILCCEYLMILCWDLNLGICCSGHAVSWISHLPLKHSKKGWNRNADVLQLMM